MDSFLKSKPPTDVNHRCDALLFFWAADCNPNGEPEDGNRPRQDAETGHGIATDVCLKRHIRDTAAVLSEEKPDWELYVTRRSILDHKLSQAYKDLGIKPKKGAKKNGDGEEEEKDAPTSKEEADNEAKGKAEMCRRYWDIRTFGAVMGSKVANCGQVRGAIQISFARSLHPVTVSGVSVTRCAIQTDREAETNFRNQTFGDKALVPFGFYSAQVFFNPFFAKATGFNPDDFELFWESMGRLFEYSRSSARGKIGVEQIVVFEHDSPLGRAPSQRLFRTVMGVDEDGRQIVRLKKESTVPRSVEDYTFPTKEETEERVKKLGYKGISVHYLL